MVNSIEFAKRLQGILTFYGLSATSFSEKISFNRSTISHLLSGRNKPSLEFVMKVLHQFPEVQLYWLLNGTGAFPSSSSEKIIEAPMKITSPSNSEVENSLLSHLTEKTVLEGKTNSDSKSVFEIERIIIFYKDGSFKAYQ
ncbi:MAG: helix-turn-helix transcriptional regulator [Flavobacteriaceae bacterium]|nr:helix-turn-helix transcriptional regulator [Flavobacteriaceae bacterium]